MKIPAFRILSAAILALAWSSCNKDSTTGAGDKKLKLMYIGAGNFAAGVEAGKLIKEALAGGKQIVSTKSLKKPDVADFKANLKKTLGKDTSTI